MLQLHAAAMRPEVHALRRRVEDLLDDACPRIGRSSPCAPPCWPTASPSRRRDVRHDLISLITDVLEISAAD
jgi:hypothetical protein